LLAISGELLIGPDVLANKVNIAFGEGKVFCLLLSDFLSKDLVWPLICIKLVKSRKG